MQLIQCMTIKRVFLLLAINIIASLLEVTILQKTHAQAFQAHPNTYYYVRVLFYSPITVFSLALVFYLIETLRKKPRPFVRALMFSGYVLLGFSLLVIGVEAFKMLKM